MAVFSKLAAAAATLLLTITVSGQTFQRLGTAQGLAAILPPDQSDFLPGALFDIRVEVHAPLNGSEATGATAADTRFSFTVAKKGQQAKDAASFFNIAQPPVEGWTFGWYEDLFAQDAKNKSMVNVASKAYRKVALYEPGDYVATLTYNNGTKATANWTVRNVSNKRKAKNVLFFIGDGMTTNMITAARLIAHKSINGKYQTKMAMDQFPVLGHQMTHSVDSFITDSANSASALYGGHKTTVNALGCWVDSSPDPFDDPKFESIAELFQRNTKGGVGIVSTAFIADATPGGLTAHTRNRALYGQVVNSFLYGQTNWSWTDWHGPDVLFGGGAEQFYANSKSYQGQDYYNLFRKEGYNVVQNLTALHAASNYNKTLGIFSTSNMAKWLDRNVYTDNLKNQKNSPSGDKTDAVDQPGLSNMTVKAMEILTQRHGADGWFLMSEAASIDKQMHLLDYDRALGELLELDDTIKASIDYLKRTNQLEDTLIVVTADHGHGFDVAGSADTKYLEAQTTDRKKRGAIGTYQNSGLSQYVVADPSKGADSNLVYTEGHNFPANWDPRYTLFDGVAANPDHRENYRVHKNGPRLPASNITAAEDYYVDYKDAPTGFVINGTLSVSNDQGVHSLTDVPVFARGPCQSSFSGVYNNIDIFFNIAECLGLSQPGPNGQKGPTSPGPRPPSYSKA